MGGKSQKLQAGWWGERVGSAWWCWAVSVEALCRLKRRRFARRRGRGLLYSVSAFSQCGVTSHVASESSTPRLRGSESEKSAKKKKPVSCENRSDLRVPLEGLRDPRGPQGTLHGEPRLCSSRVVGSPCFPRVTCVLGLDGGAAPSVPHLQCRGTGAHLSGLCED